MTEPEAKLCPRCGGCGVTRRAGRPRVDGRVQWHFCSRCDSRGWVWARPGRRSFKEPVAMTYRDAQPRREDGRQLYERWRDGETYAEIGVSIDLSRERVRQLIYREVPPWEIKLTHQLHLARGRLRAFVNRGTIPVQRECWICGTAIDSTGSSRSADNPTCLRHRDRRETGFISNQMRLVVNSNGRRDAHRTAPSQGPIQGTGYMLGTRHVVRGSHVDDVICEAIEQGWPILDLLPPELVEQGREHLRERAQA